MVAKYGILHKQNVLNVNRNNFNLTIKVIVFWMKIIVNKEPQKLIHVRTVKKDIKLLEEIVRLLNNVKYKTKLVVNYLIGSTTSVLFVKINSLNLTLVYVKSPYLIVSNRKKPNVKSVYPIMNLKMVNAFHFQLVNVLTLIVLVYVKNVKILLL